MHKGRKAAVVATVLALALAGAAGAAGLLTLRLSGSDAGGHVTVHGKWTLVVRDRHGKVVARRRFENALQTGGRTVLTGLLTGRAVLGGWEVMLNQPSPANPLACSLFAAPCVLYQSGRYPGGTLSLANTQTDLTLAGSFSVIVGPATFDQVETRAWICGDPRPQYTRTDVEPDDCGPPESSSTSFPGNDVTGVWTVTQKSIAPLTVQAGQSVAVTVHITFS
jgi:hypothetical protein